MKRFTRLMALCLALVMPCSGALAATLNLPTGIRIIEADAFRGDDSLDRVVLAEGVEEIRARAFADSGLNEIDLPESVARISDTAFDGPEHVRIHAKPGSYAYEWAMARGYLDGSETDVFDTRALTDGTVEITGYHGAGGAVVVPGSIGGRQVKAIGDSAFRGNADLRHIDLSAAAVERIGDYAFYRCAALRDVNVKSGLVEIGDHAFEGCEKLARFAVPDTVQRVGSRAFSDCASLIDISLPRSVTQLGDYTFRRCASLVRASFHTGFGSIPRGMFQYCGNLETLNIGNSDGLDSFAEIGDWAFDSCVNLDANLFINYSSPVLRRIGSWAFHNCDSLDFAPIPVSVTTIGDSAFRGCALMTDAALPDSVSAVGRNAFSDCPSLKSFYVNGASLTDIPNGLFKNCRALCEVELPESVTAIGDEAFSGCVALNSLSLPGNLRSIGSLAFETCIRLMSLYIPASVTEIADDAFHDCWSGMVLSGNANSAAQRYAEAHGLSFVVSGSTVYDAQNGFEYEIRDGVCVLTGYTGGATALSIPARLGNRPLRIIEENAFRGNDSLVTVEIPMGVFEIRSGAFADCTALEEVELPASCDQIESYAFSGCSSLWNITLSESLLEIPDYCFHGCGSLPYIAFAPAVQRIGTSAFENCGSLADVVLSDGLKIIGDNAFANSGVENIELPETLTTIGHHAFYNCVNLSAIRIPPLVRHIGHTAFCNCESMETVELSRGLTSIGNMAFHNCASLTTITIPEGVRIISASAFADCVNLAYVGIPGSLTAIQDRAFDDCDTLDGVDLPDALSSIGAYAFRSCDSLTGIDIPNGVSSLGVGAFAGCGSLSGVRLPDRLDAVPDNLFAWCGQLTDIDIPDGTRIIGAGAFDGCGNLRTVTVPGSVESIGANAFRNCGNVMMCVTPGSYAESYAQSADMDYETDEMSGTGALMGTVLCASDQRTAVPNAHITIFSGDQVIVNFRGYANGSFTVSDLPSGKYRVVVTAGRFRPFTDYVVIRRGETTYMETFLMVEGAATDRGTASGRITDAISGDPLESVLIRFRQGWDNPDQGETVAATETDSNGRYTINLPIGNYTACVWRTGYLESSFNVVVQKDVDTPNQDHMMSTTVMPDQYRIILTWGNSPRDLDAHVRGRLSGGGDLHVYFEHKSAFDADGTCVCNLDRDDTTGNGREVVTLTPTVSDPYYYYVDRYSTDGSIPASGACVEIFRGSKRLRVLNVPRDAAAAKYWNVFTIRDGRLIMRNTMTDTPETGYDTGGQGSALTVSVKKPVVYLGGGQRFKPEYVFSDGENHTYYSYLTRTGGDSGATNGIFDSITAQKPGKAVYDCRVVVTDPSSPGGRLELHTSFTVYVVCALNAEKDLEIGVGETYDIVPELYTFKSGEPAIDLTKAVWDFYYPLGSVRYVSNSQYASIAKINGGPAARVTGLKKDVGSLDLSLHSDQYGFETTMSLGVDNAPTGITFEQSELKLGIGETFQVSPILRHGSWHRPVWTSENPAVAKVDQDGVVTAVGTGSGYTATTWIRVTAGTVSNRLKVTVGQKPTGIRLNPTSLKMVWGFLHKTPDYTFTNTGAIGKVEYTSSDPNIVAITKKGDLEARGVGTATITAALAGDRSIKATCTVTVEEFDIWKKVLAAITKRDKVLKKTSEIVKSFSSMLKKDCDENAGEKKAALISRIAKSISVTDSISISGVKLPEEVKQHLCGRMLDVIYSEMQRDRKAFKDIKDDEKFIREVARLCLKDNDKYTFPIGSQVYTYEDVGAGDADLGGRISLGWVSGRVDGIPTRWPLIIVFHDRVQIQAYMDELRALADLKLDEAKSAVISDSMSILELDTLSKYLNDLAEKKHNAAFKKVLACFPDLEALYNELVDLKKQIDPMKEGLDTIKELTNVDMEAMKTKSFSELTSWMTGYSSKVTNAGAKLDAAWNALENFRY